MLINLLLMQAVAKKRKRVKNVYPRGFTSLIRPKLEASLKSPIYSEYDIITDNISPTATVTTPIDRSRRTQERYKTQPIRIKYITTPLEQTISKSNNYKTKLRGQAVINQILPQLASDFASTLQVMPTKSLSVPSDACFGYFQSYIPYSMYKPGVKDYDIIIIISASDSLGDQKLCHSDPNLSTLAVSSPCNVDSNDRPVIGFANICLNALDVTIDDKIDQSSILMMEDVLAHEFIHIFGLNSALFKYYRSAYDNRPLTTRRNTFFGFNSEFETERFRCVNDKPDQTLEAVSVNTLVYNTETVRTYGGFTSTKGYYEIVLPTVAQVVRNHFNCSSLTGARLENQPTSDTDCIGSHFDERYFFTDIMSALYDDDAAYFSPLTLALLEDTGWYKSNFLRAQNSPFGLGMGCDFVKKACIVDGKVPTYSRGFFCNNFIDDIVKCGPSHHYRGNCDLTFTSNPKRDYFLTQSIGPQFTHADFCPIIRSDVTDCDNESAVKIDSIEVFDEGSRCLSVNLQDGTRTAVCIRATCNEDTKTFVFHIGTNQYDCGVNEEGKEISVSHNNKVYKFFCPRLSQVCPE